MKNELIRTETMSFADIINMGNVFAESGMFEGARSAAQAIVKIQAGQEIGIPPFAAMTGIHIIKGRPTIGAGLIASRIKGSGKYDYRVVQQDEKICTLDFYQGTEKIGTSTFTIDDAKKAQTQNIDKFPRNMLFARAVSNGVKWFCPDVFSGPVYTREELESGEPETPPFEVVGTKLGTVPPLQPIQPSEADMEFDKEVKQAVDCLTNCQTVGDLTQLKEMLDSKIVDSNAFKIAGAKRYKEISQPAATTA